jgi:4'-phosphopantetheinyl transferase EntD
LITEILPSNVCTVDRRGDISETGLLPEERAAIGQAVGKRRREFATGRACAHEALQKLGIARQAIVPGEGGAPAWPPGIVGSITHCEGYRACAVAMAEDFVSIGIDAEPNQSLRPELLPDIALPSEIEWLDRLRRDDPSVSWDRLLFSIKETVYKAWFPLAGRWLGFEDAAIEVDIEHRTFEAQLLVEGPKVGAETLTGFSGKWLAAGGFVHAAIALPRP